MKSQNSKEQKSDFSYKETLNLLKTDFSMRANSVVREPEIQKFWANNDIDFQLGSNNSGEIFTLLVIFYLGELFFFKMVPIDR